MKRGGSPVRTSLLLRIAIFALLGLVTTLALALALGALEHRVTLPVLWQDQDALIIEPDPALGANWRWIAGREWRLGRARCFLDLYHIGGWIYMSEAPAPAYERPAGLPSWVRTPRPREHTLDIVAYGLPLPCMTDWETPAGSPAGLRGWWHSVTGNKRFPVRPAIPPLLINTLAWSATWWMALRGPRLIRRLVRRRRGHCPACGYDLRGGTGAECPECGHSSGRRSTLPAPCRPHRRNDLAPAPSSSGSPSASSSG